MSDRLRTAATLQLAGLTWLGIYDWGTVAALEPGRWPVSAVVWISAFWWLLRSPSLPTIMLAPPLAALGLWSIWYLIAVNWSLDARPSLAFSVGIFSTVMAGAWFVAAYGWDRFATILTLTIATFLLIGLAYRASAGSFFNPNGRFAGLGNNPTDTGRHAAMMVVLALSAFRDRAVLRAAFVVGGLAFTALAVAKTALAGLAIVVLFLMLRRAGPFARSAFASLGVVALMAVTVVLLRGADSWLTASTEPNVATPLTLTGRTGIWYLAWDAIVQRPVIGHGTGSSFAIFGREITDGWLSWRVTNSHNLWLHSLLEHGLVGTLCLIAAAVAIINRARHNRDPYRDAVLLLVFISSMTEALMQYPSLVVLIVAGGAAAVSTAGPVSDRFPFSDNDPLTGDAGRVDRRPALTAAVAP